MTLEEAYYWLSAAVSNANGWYQDQYDEDNEHLLKWKEALAVVKEQFKTACEGGE